MSVSKCEKLTKYYFQKNIKNKINKCVFSELRIHYLCADKGMYWLPQCLGSQIWGTVTAMPIYRIRGRWLVKVY